jgi:hypothetical protein
VAVEVDVAVGSAAVGEAAVADLDLTSLQNALPSLANCPTHVKKISYSERLLKTCHTSTLPSTWKTCSQLAKLTRFLVVFVNILSQLSYQKM